MPGLLLAVKWDLDSKADPTGWWCSEKLDGVRYVVLTSVNDILLTLCARIDVCSIYLAGGEQEFPGLYELSIIPRKLLRGDEEVRSFEAVGVCELLREAFVCLL